MNMSILRVASPILRKIEEIMYSLLTMHFVYDKLKLALQEQAM